VSGGYRDYRDPKVMADGAAIAAARRGGNDHEFIVGGFRLLYGQVVLSAIEMGPAFNVMDQLTVNAKRFARWRTKQAAWRWLQCRPDRAKQLRVIHLGRLDVMPGSEAPPA
jgi:hypothetical protein